MAHFYTNPFFLIATGVLLALAVVLVCWLLLRHRPTPEEIEQARRKLLVDSGRLVDGMLLDIYAMDNEQGQPIDLLLFEYRIGGVDYQCTQEITSLRAIVDPAEVRAGFPCSVRYQTGNPQNSIVIAEGWSGIRTGLPVLPVYADPEPLDLSHRRRYNS